MSYGQGTRSGRASARPAVHVVLVGAGHAHLYVLHHAARLRQAGVRLTLVAPQWFHYSGLATAVLSGDLEPGAGVIDVGALAHAVGVDWRPGRVVAVDRDGRTLVLDTGQSLAFDAASFNIGSETTPPPGASAVPGLWRVKPLTELLDLREALAAAASAGIDTPAVVVAGGGPSGFEVVAALAGLARRLGLESPLYLVTPTGASWGPPGARRRLCETLIARGVTIVDSAVADYRPGHCTLGDGRVLPCDHLVWAGGLRPPSLIAALDLPLAADGRLTVSPTLCSIGDATIFGVGDCAVIEGAARPAAGVFGVRAAPILLNNLMALGDDRPLRRFQPQRRWLSIMDLGDGHGLAMRGRLWWLGRSALRLKRALDLAFVRRMRACAKPHTPAQETR